MPVSTLCLKSSAIAALLVVATALACTSTRNDIQQRGAALVADPGKDEVTVMDFAVPPSLKPLSPGWDQHKFFWHKPMNISFVTKKGKKAAKFHTKDSASILIRKVDAELADFPVLSWQWLVEKGITASAPENTPAGDDHPVRLIIYFEDLSGEERIIEILWGNRLKAGNTVFVHGFKHFVARGAGAETDLWYHENLDLAELYRNTFKEAPDAKITDIGIFCDSDDTNGETIAYISTIQLKKALPSASSH